jgi:hypothetical protein
MLVQRCYVLSKEDIEEIHIVPVLERRDEQGCTYPYYKTGDAFILHYPGKVRSKKGGGVAVVYLGWPLRDVVGRTPTQQGTFHRHAIWLTHMFRLNR